MDIQHIKNYIILCEIKNISKTSEKLYISQPALTKQINSLEESLGCRLFKRSKNGLELTEYGEIFLKHAKNIANEYEILEGDIAKERERQYTNIAIGYSSGGYRRYIEQAIPKIYELSGDMSVSVVQKMPKDLVSRIKSGLVTCALIPQTSISGENELEYITVRKSGVSARLAKENPLSEKESVSVKDLAEYTLFVNNESDNSFIRYILEPFENAGIIPQIKKLSGKENIELVAGFGKTTAFSSDLGQQNDNIRLVPVSELREGFDLVLAFKKTNINPYILKIGNVMSGEA